MNTGWSILRSALGDQVRARWRTLPATAGIAVGVASILEAVGLRKGFEGGADSFLAFCVFSLSVNDHACVSLRDVFGISIGLLSLASLWVPAKWLSRVCLSSAVALFVLQIANQ